ncbi:MAG: ceramidase domain-containing protein [Pseudomonadota bacterium]
MEESSRMFRRIYGYCERGFLPGGDADAFWAEPLNAITNASFIIAAALTLVLAIRLRRMDGPNIWLITVTFAVGVGSFLFHTYAMVWAAILDTTPIMIFILSYFAISMNRFAGYGWLKSLMLMVAFLAAMIGASWVLNTFLRDIIGGSVSYVPALMALAMVGLWLRLLGQPAGNWLMVVAVIFAASLTARALDRPLCAHFLIGTHWLWHVLNGVVLGTLIVAVIRHGRVDPHPG